MSINKRTKDFCKYLADAKLVRPSIVRNNAVMSQVQIIIENADELRNDSNPTVQMILSEYEEWCELYKQ